MHILPFNTSRLVSLFKLYPTKLTCDVILGCCSARNNGCCRVLDLHLIKQNFSVLGKFDVTGSTDKPASMHIRICKDGIDVSQLCLPILEKYRI